jgi:HPt (histidine-containing phosphotransfer) domain-containing protein
MAVSNLLAAAGRDQKPSVIDEDHLGRMTLGDRSLEREVLAIFVRQTTIMLTRIAGAQPPLAAAAAHTLTGSARGIGAWRVARAAEQVEHVAGSDADAADVEAAIAELRAAALEASAAIGARLGASLNDP